MTIITFLKNTRHGLRGFSTLPSGKVKNMSGKYICTLNDALALQLSSMLDAEYILLAEVNRLTPYTQYRPLEKAVRLYSEQSADKINKIERIFNYLMTEPVRTPNIVVGRMAEETLNVMKHCTSARLRDVMLTSAFQTINQYKFAVYHSAQVIALELEVETVSDLLTEIVEWERDSAKNFNELALDEIVYHNAIT